MDQRIMDLNSEDMVSLLRKALINQSLVKAEVIDELLSNREKSVDDARKSIQGICYAIDYNAGKFIIFDTYSGNNLHTLDLPGSTPSKFDSDDWDSWGTSYAILELEELQKEGDIFFNKGGLYGLVIKDNKSYLFNPQIDEQNLLGLTNTLNFGCIPKTKNTHLPYDMFLSEDHELLCLSNRDDGKVFLFDIKKNTFFGEIAVRSAGSNKSINLAICKSKNKIFLTDNNSPNLSIYDLTTKKLDKKNPGLGILGNLCISPDQKSIYIVVTKPEQDLKNIDIETFKETKHFPPKGDLFSIGDAPSDLLTISPDKKLLFLMTYLNDPIPYTPVITVIDIEKNKAVKRFSIKDETKPITLTFRDENPVGDLNKSLEEMLLENNLISINKLRSVKMSLLRDSNNEDSEITEKSVETEEVKDEKVEEAKEEKKKDHVEVKSESLEFEVHKHVPVEPPFAQGIVPKKAKHIIIPSGANSHIIDVLVGSFWQKTEIDLTEIPEVDLRLKEIAENTRKKLEYFDIDIVNIKKFYKDNPLQGIIQREYILEMLDEEESLKRQEVKTAPANCPNCTAPLLGAWECNVCGFILEKPEDALRKKTASADHLANLTRGNYFVLDSENGLLFEVDQYKVPIWRVEYTDLDLKSIKDVLRLDNRNTLLLDNKGNTLIEITPKGRIYWEYNPAKAESKLNNPSSVTILDDYNLLIADTDNHRIMEIDLDGNIAWQYGDMDHPGIDFNQLNRPMYIQKTSDSTYIVADTGNNRIIEFNRIINTETGNYDMKILWQYGNPLNEFDGGAGNQDEMLNNPVMAYKDLTGKVMILDNGNKRAIEVDVQKNITWEYKTESSNQELNISNPTRVSKLKNKDILIVGDKKMVRIVPAAKNRIDWCSTLIDLSSRSHFRIVKENVRKVKAKHGLSSRYISKVGDSKEEEVFFADKKSETLKRVNASHYMKKAGDAKEEAGPFDDLDKKDELDSIIEAKRKEMSERKDPNKPVVLLTSGEKVISMPIILIDKNENAVLIINRNGETIWEFYDPDNDSELEFAEITHKRTVLISSSSRVYEVDMKTKKEIWECNCNAKSAIRLTNGNTLIAAEKSLRVIEVTHDNHIIWDYRDSDNMIKPVHAVRLINGNTLITYADAHQVREVNDEKETVWTFGEFKKSGSDNEHLSHPEQAIRLKNGNTLITDSKNSRIIEVDSDKKLIWLFPGNEKTSQKLFSPEYSARLKDGHTLIVHSSNKQILEVDNSGKTIWRFISQKS